MEYTGLASPLRNQNSASTGVVGRGEKRTVQAGPTPAASLGRRAIHTSRLILNIAEGSEIVQLCPYFCDTNEIEGTKIVSSGRDW